MRGVLSRAVACKYSGGNHCNKRTKDASELCHHHRRNNYQHSGGTAANMRLAAATQLIVSGDEAAVRGAAVLDQMPVAHQFEAVAGVENGCLDGPVDTIMWNRQAITLHEGQPVSVTTPGYTYTLMKAGTWVYAEYPNRSDIASVRAVTAHAMGARMAAAYRLFSEYQLFSGGLSERYDDKAEILVQLPLNDDPSLRIAYTAVTPDVLKVRITSTDAEGSEIVETYTVATKAFQMKETGIYPNNEVDMPGSMEVKGQTYPVPEALSNQRAAFFHNLTEALNVIDEYCSRADDGALHLPVGWMER